MNDTSLEIAAMVHARLMAKTGEERFLAGFRMHDAARRMVSKGLLSEGNSNEAADGSGRWPS